MMALSGMLDKKLKAELQPIKNELQTMKDDIADMKGEVYLLWEGNGTQAIDGFLCRK